MALQFDEVKKAQTAQGFNLAQAAQQATVPITSAQLTPTQPLTIPTQKPSVTEANSAVAGATQASKGITDYMSQYTPPPTAEQQQASSLTKDIQTLLGQTKGQQQALLEEENKLGLADMQKRLAQYNADILSKSAEYEVASADYERLIQGEEGKVKTMGAIRGEQGRIARNKAADLNLRSSEIRLTEAQALGAQGQIQAAQETAKRAVDLRYAAVNEELDIKTRQLEALMNSGILTRQEQLQAEARQAAYTADRERIAEEKAKAKTNLDLSLSLGLTTELMNKNGEFSSVRTGKTYSSPEELFKDYGVNSFDELYTRGMVSNVDNNTIQEKSMVGELKSKYWDAGITMADSLETAQQKLNKSKIYRKETYIAPSGNAPTTLNSMNIVDPSTDAQVKAIINSRPGDGGYGAAYQAVQARFGTQVANMYDKVYQAVFNQGGSVDAGFNDARLSAPVTTPQQRLDFQNQVQDNMRLDPAIKSYGELVSFGVPTVLSNFQTGNVNNVSDTVLMRTLAKVTDPSTGVREEEYKTFEDSIGAINRVFTLPKKWVGKGRLTDEGRQQIIKEIQDRFNARQTDYTQAYNYYNQQAKQQGVTVPPPFGSSTQQTSPTLTDEQAYEEYLRTTGQK